MEIVFGRTYRVVVRFPWGTRVEFETAALVREADGAIRWPAREGLGEATCLDLVIQESGTWVHGWVGGHCDVAVVVSEGPDAPEP